MKHYIIVKWKPDAGNREDLLGKVRTLYSGAEQVEGIRSVSLIPNCVDRPNRYDLMIVLEMDPEVLPVWDACEIHHTWKKDFGALIESKAIFDCM